MQNIKAIIWDWGRTLYQSDEKIEFPQSQEILEYCKSKDYRMVVVSKAGPASTVDVPERTQQIEASPLRKFFELAFVTDQDKAEFFERAVAHFNLPREQILMIGDRARREVTYANKHGHPSIWIQKGKFAHELPDEQTGQPTHTVKSLSEIKNII